MFADDALRAFVLYATAGNARVVGRQLLQRRGSRTAGRTVELVTLATGQPLIVKCRNDRPLCRESLFYRELAPVAGPLVPGCLAAATVDGVHVLALEFRAGRAADPARPVDVGAAMAALAAFHRAFTAWRPAGVVAKEVVPEPIEKEAIARSYVDRLALLRHAFPSVRQDGRPGAQPVDVVDAYWKAALAREEGAGSRERALLAAELWLAVTHLADAARTGAEEALVAERLDLLRRAAAPVLAKDRL